VQTGAVMSVAAHNRDDVGAESFADELKPGTRLLLGQYTIESFLNAGGFGITYLARDSLDRRVVLKECFPSAFCRRTGMIVGARSRQRQEEFRSIVALFLQEAMNLSQLNHPNIVKVHQVFQDNATAYMAMDHVEGPDLMETIEGSAPRLTCDQIVHSLTRMLDALSHVHAQGFLHRDISPDNILLDGKTGEPVLIDFGAARKDVTRKSRALSGLRVVKDGYSPQEFYISGSLQAPCSDLYALAASYCHLISGEAPKTSQERLAAIANGQGDPQRPLVGRVKGYRKAFLAAIDQAMSIFPRDRLQSTAEWLALLATDGTQPLPLIGGGGPRVPQAPLPGAAAMEAIALPPVTPGRVTPAPVAAPQRLAWRRTGLAAAAVAVAVGLAAVSAAFQPRPGPVAAMAFAPAPTGQSRAVQLPFVPDRAEPNRVAALLPWSPDWLVPGQRIVEVNGVPVRDGAALQAMMAGDADLSRPGAVEVILGTEAGPGAPIVRQRATLPVVDQLRLAGGLGFEMLTTPTGVRTAVTGLPRGGVEGLQVGDVLLAYAATGETLGTVSALQEILQREVDGAVATYGFVVQRMGGVTVGSFRLPVAE